MSLSGLGTLAKTPVMGPENHAASAQPLKPVEALEMRLTPSQQKWFRED
jgi:hypothetical protein